MKKEFLTFLKFNRVEEAENAKLFLEENGFEVEIENERKYFDVSYANNKHSADIKLKIIGSFFEKANALIDSFYQKQIDEVTKDYYLFEFSNEELIEVLKKRIEWGNFNYILAKDILNKRSIVYNENEVVEEQNKIIENIAKPKTASWGLLILGYCCSILMFIIPAMGIIATAVITGSFLAFMKKTVPNGKSVWYYDQPSRQHGFIILLLVLICFILFMCGIFIWSIFG